MANTFASSLVPNIIPKTLEVLREMHPLLGDVTKDYEASAGKIGTTVNIQKPVALGVSAVTPAMIAPSPSNIAPGSVSLTVDKWYKSNFHLTDKEATEILAGNTIPTQVGEAVRAVVNQVSSDLMAQYYKISNTAGKPGTGAFASNSLDALAKADLALNFRNCPRTGRKAYLSLKDYNATLTNTNFQYYYQSGSNKTFSSGDPGTPFGFKPEMEYGIVTHTVGTFGGGAVATSADAAAGATSVTVAVTGGSGLALKAGDVIIFGSVLTSPYQYSVTADVSISASSTGTISLNRELSAAVASGTAVTLYTYDSSGWVTAVTNIVGDPKGFGCVMRTPSADSYGGSSLYESFPIVDPLTGAVLTMTYMGGYHMSAWEVSALYGVGVVDERRLCRMLSYTSLS